MDLQCSCEQISLYHGATCSAATAAGQRDTEEREAKEHSTYHHGQREREEREVKEHGDIAGRGREDFVLVVQGEIKGVNEHRKIIE